VLPKRSREAGSGVALKALASPNALTESRKECDPGVSANKKVSEPESKLLQLGAEQLLKFDCRVLLLSSVSEKLPSENTKSLSPPNGIVVELKFRLWEIVNGNVTVVVLKLNRLPWVVALAEESAKEEPGPLAKPVTSAAAPPGVNDAAAVARALPLKNWEVDEELGKKKILVPGGNVPAETEAWTRSL